MKVSCIIPTFKNKSKKRGALLLVLERLYALKDIWPEVEVIVVDIDGVEAIEAICAAQKLGLSVTAVQFPFPFNRSGARNFGVENSSGEFLWFLDDDTVPLEIPSFQAISTLVKKGSFACGAKRYWSKIGWDFSNMSSNLRANPSGVKNESILPCGINRESGYRDLQEFSFFGNCGFIWRSDFHLIGGFDQEMFPSRREDVELMYRLLLNGMDYVHLNDSTSVLHLTHPADLQDEGERSACHSLFREHELANGYFFRVNNLFGIDEGDGTDVLEPVNGYGIGLNDSQDRYSRN
ncbi:MAG: glycosyltransferase [Candidatus Thiodiazotropha sp.]